MEICPDSGGNAFKARIVTSSQEFGDRIGKNSKQFRFTPSTVEEVMSAWRRARFFILPGNVAFESLPP
jgi:hypothetical protein